MFSFGQRGPEEHKVAICWRPNSNIILDQTSDYLRDSVTALWTEQLIRSERQYEL